MMEKKLVLVDAYAQVYRSFYAIRGLTNERGEPTNALYGMARFLLNLDKGLPHEYGAVVFDRGKPEKRLEILPEYKATRPPMPEPMRSQLPRIRDWIYAAGWEILERPNCEADDLIAALVNVRGGLETYIVSRDKDLAQLVQEGVSIVQRTKGAWRHLDVQDVEEKYGVPPSAIPDFLALVGDSSDNIPGVPGVGPKTASKLLHQFRGIPVILDRSGEISSKSLREKIDAHAGLLRRNMELVSLDLDLPQDWAGIESLKRRKPDWRSLADMAAKEGFKSLRSTIQKALDAELNPSLF